jgi:cytochrome c oxidase cbb3-type subunit I/II
MQQADKIAKSLQVEKIETDSDKEIIALIAYLQRVGTDIKMMPQTGIANK